MKLPAYIRDLHESQTKDSSIHSDQIFASCVKRRLKIKKSPTPKEPRSTHEKITSEQNTEHERAEAVPVEEKKFTQPAKVVVWIRYVDGWVSSGVPKSWLSTCTVSSVCLSTVWCLACLNRLEEEDVRENNLYKYQLQFVLHFIMIVVSLNTKSIEDILGRGSSLLNLASLWPVTKIKIHVKAKVKNQGHEEMLEN